MRAELTARAAPGRPEVNQDDAVGGDGLLEVLLRQSNGSHVSPCVADALVGRSVGAGLPLG